MDALGRRTELGRRRRRSDYAAFRAIRPESGVSIVIGIVLAALFLYRQGRLAQPLADLKLFHNRLFGSALGMLVLATLLSAGSQFLVMQYLQLVRGLPPIQAGLWSLPITVGVMIGAIGGPALAGRMKLSILLSGGPVVSALGMVLLTRVSGPSDLFLAVAGTAIIGLGIGPMISLGTALIVGAAPPERAGAASAMASTGTELGSALGVAVIGSVGFAVYRANLANRLPEGAAHLRCRRGQGHPRRRGGRRPSAAGRRRLPTVVGSP